MAKTTRRQPAAADAAASPPSARAPRGLSVHVGMNAVSARHYGGWEGQLVAAEADATAMAAIATASGMAAQVLLSTAATRAKVLTSIRTAATTLRRGDVFFLSFSGCGGQIPDYSGDEADRLSETWCLYDAQLLEDELFVELNRFETGTRLLIVQDTGYSGTVTRALPLPSTTGRSANRTKFAPAAVVLRTYREHKAFYDKLQADLAKVRSRIGTAKPSARAPSSNAGAPGSGVEATLIVMTSAMDNQTSLDGDRHSVFTAHLLDAWDEGRFQGNYTKLHQRVKAMMPPTQTPDLVMRGETRAFQRERPFSVSPT